ncbi:MAG: FtsW/RodA/SpoVE family cell cycle protein, partial [Hydrogenophaga sp.]
MAVVFDKPTLWQRVAPIFQGFDYPLMFGILVMAGVGLITMYSVGFDHGSRFVTHGRNMVLAAGVLFLVAQVPPQRLMALAVPMYVLGLALLLAVFLFGIEKKGAQRWLNIGVVIQPSELMKVAMPLMLAWWFQRREGQLKSLDFVVAGVLLAIPAALILKQPDLGTTLLVLASGLAVIFFAGLSWKLIIPPVLIAVVGVFTLIVMEDQWCAPKVDWVVLHEYQRQRVCTLLDPFQDPLGKGFHIIQGMIA